MDAIENYFTEKKIDCRNAPAGTENCYFIGIDEDDSDKACLKASEDLSKVIKFKIVGKSEIEEICRIECGKDEKCIGECITEYKSQIKLITEKTFTGIQLEYRGTYDTFKARDNVLYGNGPEFLQICAFPIRQKYIDLEIDLARGGISFIPPNEMAQDETTKRFHENYLKEFQQKWPRRYVEQAVSRKHREVEELKNEMDSKNFEFQEKFDSIDEKIKSFEARPAVSFLLKHETGAKPAPDLNVLTECGKGISVADLIYSVNEKAAVASGSETDGLCISEAIVHDMNKVGEIGGILVFHKCNEEYKHLLEKGLINVIRAFLEEQGCEPGKIIINSKE
ncbi:MAG: hypothetical protein FJ088_02055 [Deltaproteobacteria bacterium]|nr:hypothetical protein [Deltaproteobacteria bacterium]